MIERLLLKLRARDDVSPDKERVLRTAVSHIRPVVADQIVVHAHTDVKECNLLLEGVMCRYKDLADGERQISELHVAGDFVDLHSFPLKRLDHDVLALTAGRIAIVPHDHVLEITEKYPHLCRLLWFSTTMDAAIHREWVLSLGRRSAISRIAHLFCELHVRLGIVGLGEETGFDWPLTQQDLAECLGLTPIHVNRVLGALKTQGVVAVQRGRVAFLDFERLREIAEFSTDYLFIEKRPR
ncbi:MAG: Crp/Fnr family transcriptional regulator [Sphingomonadales bacterium]|nr:Crp/Fnr family transcriptional regulator [Sphingomonadales bacterium]